MAAVCRKAMNKHLLEEIPFNYVDGHYKAPIIVNVRIRNCTVPMESDTGSGISTMEIGKFRRMFPREKLFTNDIRLRTATGETFEPVAYVVVPVNYNEQCRDLKLYLVNHPNFPTLFGRSWLRSMKSDIREMTACFYSKVDYKEEAKKLLLRYPKLSEDGIGKIPGIEASLHLKQSTRPSYFRPRPVPHALLPLVDEELDQLEKFDVIERVNASEWAHPVVIAIRGKGSNVKKKARVCGDFKVGLNQFLVVDDHPLKNIRYALDNQNLWFWEAIHETRCFQRVLSYADSRDRKYITVNTHRGLYRFKRMCTDLASAPAI